ncbi:unnamed protein product [Aspergillus oryzae]|uniref:Unnamed protein product n=2 Tax=Aspergillus oryzae TaxID=5062 RepID=A0AAN4YGA2_ASPOZ|nr:unnamed protein product [Aspergillus oryzae]GMF92889.1 unnamed protein product [Aspergillus oryzae]GMG25990.1 unnamed protein product [Aspergillus oryzae]GMG45360.1 unnamed protein product [Aspergillus oryzae var. brunneus]
MSELNPTNIEALKRRMQSVCSDPDKGLPGVSVAVVGRDGKQLFSHAAGKRGHGSSELMSVDSVFWIASCTKMITVKLGADVEIIAGFGYTFYNEKLRDYARPAGFDEFSGYAEEFNQPLVHQPGEAWEYGIGIDWAGVVLERVTGQSLNDYFHQHIFEPIGLKHISMLPTEEMKANLAYMHQRAADGQISVRDHLLRRALTVKSESDIKSYFNSGGAGCFSTAQDYSPILLNGTSPTTGKQLLKKETVDEMFRNQIENLPPLAEKYFPDAKAEFVQSGLGLHPTVEGDRQGWGLTFLLSGGSTGRSIGTAQWSGVANLRWWCDREKGVAGFICSQVLPYGDEQLFQLSQDVETEVYKGLAL